MISIEPIDTISIDLKSSFTPLYIHMCAQEKFGFGHLAAPSRHASIDKVRSWVSRTIRLSTRSVNDALSSSSSMIAMSASRENRRNMRVPWTWPSCFLSPRETTKDKAKMSSTITVDMKEYPCMEETDDHKNEEEHAQGRDPFHRVAFESVAQCFAVILYRWPPLGLYRDAPYPGPGKLRYSP